MELPMTTWMAPRWGDQDFLLYTHTCESALDSHTVLGS